MHPGLRHYYYYSSSGVGEFGLTTPDGRGITTPDNEQITTQ